MGSCSALRHAHGKLVALPPHRLDENGELEFPPPFDHKGVRAGEVHPDAHVVEDLLLEPFPYLAGRDEFPLPSRHRRGIDGEDHGERRLVHRYPRQLPGILGVTHRVADVHTVQSGQGHDIAGGCGFNGNIGKPLEGVEHAHLRPAHLPLISHDAHGLALPQLAGKHPPDGEPSRVVVVVYVRDEHLEGGRILVPGPGYVVHNQVKEGPQVLEGALRLRGCHARPGVGVHKGKLKLLLFGVQVDEEVVDLVQDLLDPGVRPVYLVDDEDGRKLQLQGLLQNEPGLRERSLGCVHQEEHAVHHLQRSLHLAAEIRVPRGVHDVDGHVAV
jgi:hypothetical protein